MGVDAGAGRAGRGGCHPPTCDGVTCLLRSFTGPTTGERGLLVATGVGRAATGARLGEVAPPLAGGKVGECRPRTGDPLIRAPLASRCGGGRGGGGGGGGGKGEDGVMPSKMKGRRRVVDASLYRSPSSRRSRTLAAVGTAGELRDVRSAGQNVSSPSCRALYGGALSSVLCVSARCSGNGIREWLRLTILCTLRPARS